MGCKKLLSPSYLSRFSTIMLMLCAFVIACVLMLSTFGYDQETSSMKIASKVSSDFLSHIPLIRSFSLGDNFARILQGEIPEYPLFLGEPSKYHFGFFMLVGLLERLGLRIDWALNVPSILGFFFLSSMVFFLSKKLFNDIIVPILSLLFFFFNGSFAFIDFFIKNPLSIDTLNQITSNKEFWGHAPWGDGTIASMLINLNVYTNQRHLAGAFGLVLLFIFTALYLETRSWKKQMPYAVLWGLVLGFFPFYHQPSLLILGIITAWYWLVFPKLRRYLTVVGIVSLLLILPQILMATRGQFPAVWYPGYIIRHPVNLASFISFWWQNVGLHSLLIPFGFLIAPLKVKKYLFPIFAVFALGNLVIFSPDPATNHKFFNFVLLTGNMLSAYVLALFIRESFRRHSVPVRFICSVSFVLMILLTTLSGVIDFFAVVGDDIYLYPDVNNHPVSRWVKENTLPSARIMNRHYFSPALLAGRKIYLGWQYFTWGAGYKIDERVETARNFFSSSSHELQCDLLKANRLDYILLEYPCSDFDITSTSDTLSVNGSPVYKTEYGGINYSIYETKSYCDGV